VYFRVISVNPSIYMRAAGPNWACALFHYLPQNSFSVQQDNNTISLVTDTRGIYPSLHIEKNQQVNNM
jgi:hypothetical protein